MLNNFKWLLAFCASLIIHASLGLSYYSDWNTPKIERSAGVAVTIAEMQTSLLSGEVNSKAVNAEPRETKEEKTEPEKSPLKSENKEPDKIAEKQKLSLEQSFKKKPPKPLEQLVSKQKPPSAIKTQKAELLGREEKEILKSKQFTKKAKEEKEKKKQKRKKASKNSKKAIGNNQLLKKTKVKKRVGNQGKSQKKISGKASLSNYKGRIRSKLMRYVKSSNTSGAVYIGFTIIKSGSILNLRIIKSSGNKTLDKLALSAARRASPFPKLPRGHKRLSIKVPIRFR